MFQRRGHLLPTGGALGQVADDPAALGDGDARSRPATAEGHRAGMSVMHELTQELRGALRLVYRDLDSAGGDGSGKGFPS
eukprot:3992781-Alexandrium_andersonii.AAC.1